LMLFSWIFLSFGYLQWVPVLSAPDLSPFIPQGFGICRRLWRICSPQAASNHPKFRTHGFLFWFVQRCVAKHAFDVFAGNFGTLPKGGFGAYAVLPYTCRLFYILASMRFRLPFSRLSDQTHLRLNGL
jgi:hypothetical protein